MLLTWMGCRQWDGLLTGEQSRILVLGATNRPNDIDPAILRRMPKRFAIRLPDRAQRRKILDLVRFEDERFTWSTTDLQSDLLRCFEILRYHPLWT